MMNPKIRATVEVGVSAFGVGFLAYLEPVLNGGSLPPQAQWGHILLMAAVSGAMMAYHRLTSSPADVAADRPKPPDPTPPGMAMRGLILLFGLGFAARALIGCAMAPAAAVATAVPIVEATADLVCTTAAAVDQNEPDWFKFLCHYIDPAGTAPTAVPAPAFVVKVPAAHAYAFMKAHVPAAGL